MTPLQEARSLAQRGDLGGAIRQLKRGADAGDCGCHVDLGFLYLKGQGLPRDLARSRHHFASAAELGDPRARAIHTAFTATGVGGPANFPKAVEQLRAAAALDANAAAELALIESMSLTEAGDPESLPEPRVLADTPRTLLFPHLLTAEECRFLIRSAGPAFRPAHVGDTATGRQSHSNVRTCESAAFPWVAESPAIHAINRRIAAASKTSVEWGEPLQILRYRPGQEFKPHRDCTERTDNQRVLTMLIYLNDAYTGGETLFLKNGLKVRGDVGDGLLFRNADDRGTPDPASLHAGLPVETGEKLVASRWIRQKPVRPAG